MVNQKERERPARVALEGVFNRPMVIFCAFTVLLPRGPLGRWDGWKVLLGPFAFYFVRFGGKEATLAWSLYAYGGMCILMVLPHLFMARRWSRLLARLGIVLWLLSGLGYVGAWK